MKKLARYLLDRGVLTSEQLQEALQCQVAFGGRLGTNLVELGYLELSELEKHLSEFVGVPAPTPDQLENINEEVLKAVPRDLVERHKVLPFRVENRAIHVAMIDPHHPSQLDDVAFASSRRVQPYVVSEIRMYQWLERYFGMEPDTRFSSVPKKVSTPEPIPDDETQEDVSALKPLEAGQELTNESEFAEIYAERAPASSPELQPQNALSGDSLDAIPASEVLDARDTVEVVAASIEDPSKNEIADARRTVRQAVQLEAELLEVSDRDQLVEVALELAKLYTDAAALFVIHQSVVQGVRAINSAAVHHSIDGILLPTDVKSIITGPATGEIYRGAPIEGSEVDLRVLRSLGRGVPKEAATLPVRIRHRIVNVLYFDNGNDPFAETCFAALRELADRMTAAYERLILQRKAQNPW